MNFKIGDMVYYKMNDKLSFGIIYEIDLNRYYPISVYFHNSNTMQIYSINGRYYNDRVESSGDIKSFNFKIK